MNSAVITIPLAHFDVELFGQELIEFHAAPGLPGFLVWSVFKHPAAVLSDVAQIASETVHIHRLAVQVAGNLVSLTPEGYLIYCYLWTLAGHRLDTPPPQALVRLRLGWTLAGHRLDKNLTDIRHI